MYTELHQNTINFFQYFKSNMSYIKLYLKRKYYSPDVFYYILIKKLN